jgi:hypothetical protein
MSIVYYFRNDEVSNTTVVAETVFAVGFNDKYIIAKQHPASDTNYQ